MGAEQKLYKKLKVATPKIIWNRVENISVVGMPDLLGYNANGHFFTVELKVTKSKKLKFSPHQIAFHVTHPNNTFIIAEALGPRTRNRFQMFRGSCISDLSGRGLSLKRGAWGLMLLEIIYIRLALEAWSLTLGSFGRSGRDSSAWRLLLGA